VFSKSLNLIYYENTKETNHPNIGGNKNCYVKVDLLSSNSNLESYTISSKTNFYHKKLHFF